MWSELGLVQHENSLRIQEVMYMSESCYLKRNCFTDPADVAVNISPLFISTPRIEIKFSRGRAKLLIKILVFTISDATGKRDITIAWVFVGGKSYLPL